MKTLIFSNNINQYAELSAGAKSLDSEVIAYVVGSVELADQIASFTDKVFFTPSEDRMVEEFTNTLKSVVESENPELILMSPDKSSKFMAASLAAKLGTSVITDAMSIETDGSAVKCQQLYYGGTAVKTVKSLSQAIVIVGAGTYDPVQAGAKGSVESVDMVESGFKIVRREIRKKEGEIVNLAAAKKVVGVGRGFASKDDIGMAETLAKAIGAEVGCTRPIAEGEGWMATARYIGVSGVVLKPDVYIAVGLSGQIQHTIGVSSAKTIVAINKDKNAPIFKNCDYGIVGDLYKVLPAIIDMVKAG